MADYKYMSPILAMFSPRLHSRSSRVPQHKHKVDMTFLIAGLDYYSLPLDFWFHLAQS